MSSPNYLCGSDKSKKQKRLIQSLGGSIKKYLTSTNLTVQEHITEEIEFKTQVLIRILSIVKCLANDFDFGENVKNVYEEDSEIFFSMIEMLGEFDDVMQEHLQRIQSNQLQYHYNIHKIKTELIHMLANEVKTAIVQRIKKAKYFSLIFGCAIDSNYEQQMMYLLIRCVDVTEVPVKIEEFFLGFIKVDDATRMSLFSELENIFSDLGLNIDDIRGQGYDNVATTKVCKEDVQRRLLNVNPRAFCTPCGYHSLNIALCDISNSSLKALSYFSSVHFLYTLFSSSTKGLDILKRHVAGLTLELFHQTRWESQVEYVRPVSCYSLQIRDALDDLADESKDPMTCYKARSLADREFGSFEFLVSTVIWYKVLSVVNTVSMTFQSEDMHVDVAIDQLRRLIAHFREYREHDFNDALTEAQELARQLDVEPVFLKRKQIIRKTPFDEDSSEETMISPQESFRLQYFMHIVDGALASLDERLEQFYVYEFFFGFLYDLKKCTNDECLRCSCHNLSYSLAHNGKVDFKGDGLQSCYMLNITFHQK